MVLSMSDGRLCHTAMHCEAVGSGAVSSSVMVIDARVSPYDTPRAGSRSRCMEPRADSAGRLPLSVCSAVPSLRRPLVNDRLAPAPGRLAWKLRALRDVESVRVLWKLGMERRPASPPAVLERAVDRVTADRLGGGGGWRDCCRMSGGGMTGDAGLTSGGSAWSGGLICDGGSNGEKRTGAEGCRSASGAVELGVEEPCGWMGAERWRCRDSESLCGVVAP